MTELAPAGTARKSHLAFALLWLPRERRRDAMVFFRFCRAVDDIADEPGRSEEEKRMLFQEWLDGIGIHTRKHPHESGFPGRFASLAARHHAELQRPLCACESVPAFAFFRM